MPLPYMGSKRKLAQRLFDVISERETSNVFVDLFCGGFAVGEVFAANRYEVHANDINRFVVAFLQKVISNDDEWQRRKFEFIGRQTFEDLRDGLIWADDWEVGRAITCYSFGNNLQSYLYGKGIEQVKELLHYAVMDDDNARWQLNENFKKFNLYLPRIEGIDIYYRKLIYCQIVTKCVSFILPPLDIQHNFNNYSIDDYLRLKSLNNPNETTGEQFIYLIDGGSRYKVAFRLNFPDWREVWHLETVQKDFVQLEDAVSFRDGLIEKIIPFYERHLPEAVIAQSLERLERQKA
jgi:hypothetical protein